MGKIRSPECQFSRRGQGSGRLGEKGVGGVREAGEEGGRKCDSQGGRKPEKKGEIMQHCAIFCN